ncbi:MAG: DUF1552 domain-containing protein [Planctomycetota bacterium]
MPMSRVPTNARRAFLRGAGVTFALPWLESLAHRLPVGERAAWQQPPRRLCVMVTPNGMLPSAWHRTKGEPDAGSESAKQQPAWLPSYTLASLAPHAQRVGVFTGLANRQSFRGDGHYAKVAPLLTGQKIRRTGGRDLWNGLSLDQLAAQQLGQRTLLPSLELGCDPIYPVEDMGYSTVYGGHISWSAPDRPVLKEIVPRRAFDRMFRSRELARDETRDSVLDAVRRDSLRLRARLSARDRRKLEEYEEAVRALELRIDAASVAAARGDGGVARSTALWKAPTPAAGKPSDYPTHVELMLDLVALAFQSDTTRIVTFLTANEVSSRNFSWIDGCAGNFHSFSHHENKPEKLEPYRKINRWHVERYAGLLDRLAAVEEGDGTLLDNCSVVLAAAMSDGNRHSPHNLPIVVAGGGTPTGRIVSPKDTPLCRLWLSLLRGFGVEVERFGDAEKPLF